MMNQFCLIALVPNQHTRLLLQEARSTLYRDCGLASALALEPVIPLTSVLEIPEKDKVICLLTPPTDSTTGVAALETTGFINEGGHLFLRINRPELVAELRSALVPLPGAVSSPLPMGPGVFMAVADTPCVEYSGPRKFRWTGNRIGFYEISYNGENKQWWDGMEWSLVRQFPFRKWKK